MLVHNLIVNIMLFVGFSMFRETLILYDRIIVITLYQGTDL